MASNGTAANQALTGSTTVDACRVDGCCIISMLFHCWEWGEHSVPGVKLQRLSAPLTAAMPNLVFDLHIDL